MKRRGIVKDVDDPKQLGRIRVELIGFDLSGNVTPWCWPCSPFAGPGYGFYFLPVPGDEVYVEKTDEGDWVWAGFCWTKDRNPKPVDGGKFVRVIRTPIGHQIKLDENGDVEISHTSGALLRLKPNGDIELNGNEDNVVGYAEMKSAFDSLKASYNSHAHTGSGTSPPTAISTADMSGAKVDEVKIK